MRLPSAGQGRCLRRVREALRADEDGARTGGEFDRIAHQVPQYLCKTVRENERESVCVCDRRSRLLAFTPLSGNRNPDLTWDSPLSLSLSLMRDTQTCCKRVGSALTIECAAARSSLMFSDFSSRPRCQGSEGTGRRRGAGGCGGGGGNGGIGGGRKGGGGGGGREEDQQEEQEEKRERHL